MLTLASNSTTRAKILKDAGIKFQQRSVDFDETTICDSNPNALVYKIAKGKLLRYTSLYGTDVCESYEAVYNMLAELDKAYEA